jgi:opacity protein-like surface antigen
MSARQFWIAVLSVITILAASMVAQDEKNELGGVIGRVFISDQGLNFTNFPDPTIHSGKGLTFAGEYARRFWITPIFSLAGEGVVAYNPTEKLNAGAYGFAVVPTSYSQLFVTPAARLNLFPTTAVSPWVSLGAGFAHFNESSMLIYGGANPGKSTTSAVLEGGLGLDVKLVSTVSVRGEFRDFWSGEPDFPLAPTGKTRQHNFFVGGGAFWRF